MNDRVDRKLEALRNILRLEKGKGYPDTSVVGGVDRFLEKWVEDPEVRLRLTYAQIPIPSYAQLSPAERGAWAELVGQRLLAAEKAVEAEQPGPSVLDAGVASKRAAATRIRGQMAKAKSALSAAPVRKGGVALGDPLPPLRGVTEETRKKLAKLGVTTFGEAVTYFPYRHVDFSRRVKIAELVGGIDQTVHVTVVNAAMKPFGPRRATEAVVKDETGTLRVTWFGQPYLAKQLRKGTRLALSGKIETFRGIPQMTNPDQEILSDKETLHTGRLVPIYPLTEGLNQRTVRRVIKNALDVALPLVEETLPIDVVRRAGLLGRREAVGQFHYPDSQEMRERARRRLAFEELFLLQIGVLARRRDWHDEQTGLPMRSDVPVLQTFLDALPFKLTGAQERSLKDVLGDMGRPKPMSRLVQGDVGSGKTVVAAAAMLVAVANGYQAAMMAPTEILAEQHYRTISRILGQGGAAEDAAQGNAPFRGFKGFLDRPLRVAQVLGKQTKGQRNALHELIRRGDVDIVVGTHALIQEDVGFANLGLVVVDEQHRFGVEQRGQLRGKGENPHLLVMTATPIPRTLALTLYGDLDISIIDEMPPGRLEIKTRALTPADQDRAYRFVRQEVEKGRQAFVICPLVEESEAVESRAAVAEYERLSRDVFSDLRVGLLHGRMKPQEKEEAMGRFRDGALDILVSTAVVEVGVDVPNATVMLVEGAERFGLAQLHQFRGRVGRGEHQSYCMFLADSAGEDAWQRLKLLEETTDGFKLAEADLRLRGSGQFFGTRQSGLSDLKVAQIYADADLLEVARAEGVRVFREDPHLERPEHAGLREAEERILRSAEEAPNAATEEG